MNIQYSQKETYKQYLQRSMLSVFIQLQAKFFGSP